MATINSIYKQIVDEKNNLSAIKDNLSPTSAQVETLDLLLTELNSRSRVAVWRLFAFVVAVCIWLREQFFAKAVAEAEEFKNNSDVGTPRWLRRKSLEFQYSTAVPQSVVFNPEDFSIAYPTIDESLRLVTVASVITTNSGPTVLCAKGSYPFQPLLEAETNSLKEYIKQIQFAHKAVNVITLAADKLYLAGEYFYDAAYASVIDAAITAALQAYLGDLSSGSNFGGFVNLQKINDVLQSVPGVLDVALTEVSLRADGSPFANRTKIYSLAENTNLRQVKSTAGHVVLETTSGSTLDATFLGYVQL